MAFATILSVAVGIEIPRQTSSELTGAGGTTHVGVDHGRGAVVVAAAAIHGVGGGIRFTAVGRHVVAIGISRITRAEHARAAHARIRGIRERAGRIACAAVVHVGIRVDFATVRGHHVAILVRTHARRNRARTGLTSFGRIGQIARSIARAAMVHVGLNVRFTTIGVCSVAIFIGCRAGGNEAQSRGASFGCIGQIAGQTASAAIHHIRRRVDFTAVGVHLVAIGKPHGARRDGTRAARARRRRIRQFAKIAASTAMLDRGIRIRFAAVVRHIVARRRPRIATDGFARDRHDDIGYRHSADRRRDDGFGGREHFRNALGRVRHFEIQ